MPTITQRFTNSSDYWHHMVLPDREDFLNQSTDLRRALHSAISLFHLSDWIYTDYKTAIDATFTYLDKNGSIMNVSDEKTFARSLAQKHPDFELIRGICNSAKHLVIRPGHHAAYPSNAANTVVQSTGYGTGRYGVGPYGGTPRVMLQGPNGADLEFENLAQSVLGMWRTESNANGWSLP